MHQMKAIEAAREVREKLLKLSGVIGIGHGWKRTAGRKTGTYAVVVYVREKRALAVIPRGERIPRQVGGVATDVVAHGTGHGRLEDEHAHRFRDHLKVHREHVKATGGPRRSSSAHDVDIGHVAVVEDDPQRTFRMAGDDVDWIGAYRKFRLTHPDIYDFVTFWSDFPVECDCGAFYCGLANPARGINWESRLAQGRRGWGTRRLQAFHYFIREDNATLLQEVGHHWAAYAGFKTSPGDRRVRFDYCLGNEPGHWSSYFDDDRSPMDYDESELKLPSGVSADWVDNGNGTFTRRPVRQGGYAFCNLDLYLMGLIPPQEVGESYYIARPQGRGQTIRGRRVPLSIQNVIWANGARRPSAARSAKRFRQAFVLLTTDATGAQSRARHLDGLRQRYERIFREATGGRAEVDTRLAP